MRVMINQLTALRHKAGIGHYIEQLVQGLRETTPSLELVAFPSGATEWALKKWQQRARSVDRAKRSSANVGWKRWASGMGRRLAEWHFRATTSFRRFDIYHEPNMTPFPCGRPTIATIQDLSPLLHPEWHPLERAKHFETHGVRSLSRCQHFIAISEFSRREAIQHLGLDGDRVTSVPLGYRVNLLKAAGGEERFAALGLPATYLLHVGTLEPRKNLLMLLRAYCALPSALREKCPLVLAGGWGWNVRDLACYYEDEARHKNVIHLGYVPEDVLGCLYRQARALLFPSHYEGFGLPAIEMLALGGAVLCSTAGALREVVGAGGYFLDPQDRDGWHDALKRVIADDDWCDRLRPTTPESYRQMTWQRCARGTFAVYQHVMGERSLLNRDAA